MRNAVLVSLCAAIVSGCASVNQTPISQTALNEVRGQTVAKTSRKTPDFTAMTAGKAMFAAFGASAMISEGNNIVAANKIADPADAIAQALVSSLEASHGVRVVAAPVPVDADDAAQIAAAASKTARFVIDVQTINWSFGYFPTDWTHYRVIYVAKARLIDSQTKTVVAESFCRQLPEANANAPTYDELLANGAGLLKSQLAAAANSCVKAIKDGMKV